MLPPPLRRRQAAANIALLLCPHRHNIRTATVMLCTAALLCAAATAADATAKLPPTLRCRAAATADVVLSRCQHRC
jgi:hypothetical protein